MYKQKITYLALAICICLVFCSEASSEYHSSINQSEVSSYSVGVPVYEIYSYFTYLETDTNEKISINYYITGAGSINNTKIRISIPPDICSDPLNDSINLTTIQFVPEKSRIMPKYDNIRPQAAGNLSSWYFIMRDDYSTWGETVLEDGNFTSTPISLNFTIADDAPRGNHDVLFFVFYEYDNVWYSSQESVTIHVRHWYEKEDAKEYYHLAAILTITGAIITIGGAIITIYSFVKNHRNTRKSKSDNRTNNIQKGKRK